MFVKKSQKTVGAYKTKAIVSPKPVRLLLRTGDSISIKSIDVSNDKKSSFKIHNSM